MKWENRKKKWKINHEYRRVLTLDKIMGKILQEWKEKDMVSVVRCKDCKYFELNHEDEDKLCNGIDWCTNWCGGTTAEGYCCEAERREP